MENSQPTPIDRLKFSLIENALDFLVAATEYGSGAEHLNWKYSVLNLVAGIELLLKARLEVVHWSLLFSDVDKATESRLKSGDFVSADFTTVYTRLANIGSVRITDSDRKHLNDLRKLRHKIEHFTVDIEIDQIKSLLAKALSFAVRFSETELKNQISKGNRDTMSQIMERVKGFDEFVSERMAVIQPHLKKANHLQECPRCWQETLDSFEGGRLRCHFCYYEISARELAEDKSESSIDTCPECGLEALGLAIYNNEEAGWHCYFCGQDFDTISHCSECGEAFEGEGPMCDSCWSHLLSKD